MRIRKREKFLGNYPGFNSRYQTQQTKRMDHKSVKEDNKKSDNDDN